MLGIGNIKNINLQKLRYYSYLENTSPNTYNVIITKIKPYALFFIHLDTSPIKSDILPLPKRRTTITTTIAICQIPILIVKLYTFLLFYQRYLFNLP